MEKTANSKKKSPTILTVLMVVIIAAFLLVDFRMVHGEVDSSSQLSTFTFSIDKGGQLPLNQNLDIYVIGNTQIEDELDKALPISLAVIPNTNSIEVRDGEPAPSAGSVLVIEFKQINVIFTPLYSQTNAKIQAAYASDGDVDWIDEQTVELDNNQPVVRVRGDYEFKVSARGLMSLPGYRTYLADSLANQIASSLSERLRNPNP